MTKRRPPRSLSDLVIDLVTSVPLAALATWSLITDPSQRWLSLFLLVGIVSVALTEEWSYHSRHWAFHARMSWALTGVVLAGICLLALRSAVGWLNIVTLRGLAWRLLPRNAHPVGSDTPEGLLRPGRASQRRKRL